MYNIIEDGKLIGSFETAQEAFEFSSNKYRRALDGDFILKEKDLKSEWFGYGLKWGFWVGVISASIIIVLTYVALSFYFKP